MTAQYAFWVLVGGNDSQEQERTFVTVSLSVISLRYCLLFILSSCDLWVARAVKIRSSNGFIMTTKLIAYVNTSGTSWAPVRKASLGLKEQRTHGALSRPLPFPGPVCFPCTSPGAAQGWVPGSLWSRLPSSRALFLPGWGRTLGLKSHTVSLPLMSSTGSVTLSETTYNKTNFATGWLIQMLNFYSISSTL